MSGGSLSLIILSENRLEDILPVITLWLRDNVVVVAQSGIMGALRLDQSV